MHLIGLRQGAILSRDFHDHAQQFNRPLGAAVDWDKVSTRQWKRESPTHLLAECIRKECEGNLPCTSSLLTEWSIWWSCAEEPCPQRKHAEQQLLQYVPSNLSLGQVSCIHTGARAHLSAQVEVLTGAHLPLRSSLHSNRTSPLSGNVAQAGSNQTVLH